jgi:hypothetical protein
MLFCLYSPCKHGGLDSHWLSSEGDTKYGSQNHGVSHPASRPYTPAMILHVKILFLLRLRHLRLSLLRLRHLRLSQLHLM